MWSFVASRTERSDENVPVRRQRRLIPALKWVRCKEQTFEEARSGRLLSIKRKKRNAKKRSARSGARSRAFKENRKRGNYVIQVAFLVCDCAVMHANRWASQCCVCKFIMITTISHTYNFDWSVIMYKLTPLKKFFLFLSKNTIIIDN